MATSEAIIFTASTTEIDEKSLNLKMKTNDVQNKDNEINKYDSIIGTFERELKWFNIISIAVIHLVFLWGLTAFPYSQKPGLIAYGKFFYQKTMPTMQT